jgi:hypothetical protein
MACRGTCLSCKVPGLRGTCVPVPAGGPDLHGGCLDEGPAKCGRNGTCDGAGSCAPYPSGTICAPASCAGATFSLPARCDGGGNCKPGPSRSCAPYACNVQYQCFDSCAGGDDSMCAPGFTCFGASECVPMGPVGPPP